MTVSSVFQEYLAHVKPGQPQPSRVFATLPKLSWLHRPQPGHARGSPSPGTAAGNGRSTGRANTTRPLPAALVSRWGGAGSPLGGTATRLLAIGWATAQVRSWAAKSAWSS